MRGFYENRKYPDIPLSMVSPKFQSFKAHWHVEVEIVYVCEGSVQMGINMENRLLRNGDVAVCTSGDVHYYEKVEPGSKLITLIFKPELVDCPRGWPENIGFISPFIGSDCLSDRYDCINLGSSIYYILCSLMEENRNKSSYYELFQKSNLIRLCATLLRHVPSTPRQNDKIPQGNQSLSLIKQAISYLEENYMDEISLISVAENVNLSPFYFSRLFKSISGMNFKDYLNSIRVEKAEDLIRSSDKPMVEIAIECGFNSIRTFNRVFKAIKGVTPSELR